MKRIQFGLVMFICVAVLSAGCFKKSNEQAGLTGLENSTSEELAQLPQASSTSTQQTGVEVLPIEASPVTQSAAMGIPVTAPSTYSSTSAVESVSAPASTDKLSRDKEIQTALKNAGLYHGAIDGKIGPGTKKAIQAFQTSHGLKADGKVGPKTWAALEAFLSSSSTSSTAATASSQQ